jgi:tRNA nucleotidyltransferase (CCA-adding enzyme)
MCERYLFVGGIMTELESIYQSWKRARNSLSFHQSRSEIYNTLRFVSLEGIFLLIVLMEVATTNDDELNRLHNFWRVYLTELRNMKINIDGNDLKKLGLKPGPLFKAILEEVMSATLDGRVGRDKGSQLQYVKDKSTHHMQG